MNTPTVNTVGATDCVEALSAQSVASMIERAGINRPTPQTPPPAQTSGYPKRRVSSRDRAEEFQPFSLAAEAAVLGCILLDADYSLPILSREGIAAGHWYDLRLREVYRLITGMHKEGEGISEASVLMRGQAIGMFQTAEARNLLVSLADTVPSAQSLEMFLPELKDCQQRRAVLEAGRLLINLAGQREVRAARLLEDAEDAVKALRRFSVAEPFTVRSAAEVREQKLPENDNILGDRLLAKGQSLTMLGAGGIGKSRLLLQLAACCITGRPFLDLSTHAPDTRWLILQTENSNRRLQQDLNALAEWMGADWERVASRLFIHTIETAGDAFVQLDVPSARQRLRDLIDQYDPDVVCFDPLNCFGSGDLNRDNDMRQTCSALTEITRDSRADRAIVVLHHALTGRAGAARATGFDRASFGRNSKLLHAWTRGQINLAAGSAQDNQRLVLSCGKCSNGEEFEPYAIRLDPQSMIYEVNREFNLKAWEREVNGAPPDPAEELVELCDEGMTRAEAARTLMQRGYSKTHSYRVINEALQGGLLTLDGDLLRPQV